MRILYFITKTILFFIYLIPAVIFVVLIWGLTFILGHIFAALFNINIIVSYIVTAILIMFSMLSTLLSKGSNSSFVTDYFLLKYYFKMIK
ncbi:hypothetical protein [Clostridium lundense]|uniref:hypothetical protein n=1 Tax=Clostridium lundense TaxID=319475 RepID=UPI00048582F0|nr:hypothetical protein [Clostridium lundense]